jgi:two-component system, NarL family, nitrate/nitrite response regulator NarL
MDTETLRLLIIAHDPLARAGLAALLAQQPGYTVIGQLTGDSHLAADLEAYRPDVILGDLGWEPTAMLEWLTDLPEGVYPLVLLLPTESLLAEAWAAGAQGLLPRNASPEKLTAALTAAVQGLVTLDMSLARTLLPQAQAPPAPPVEHLTVRELEVLQHLAEGLSNKAIALRLNISEHTIKFHVNAIMSKLGAQSRTEAVVRATQLGLIML